MWDPKYSVNIREIDLQHQKFFEIINTIYFLVEKEKEELDKTKLKKVIDQLNEYGEYHMVFEEKYFKEFNYKETDEHVAIHNLFRDKVKEYYTAMENPKTSMYELGSEIAEFSKNWLSEHILDTDHKYISVFLTHWK